MSMLPTNEEVIEGYESANRMLNVKAASFAASLQLYRRILEAEGINPRDKKYAHIIADAGNSLEAELLRLEVEANSDLAQAARNSLGLSL
jgi:hypothetical protein